MTDTGAFQRSTHRMLRDMHIPDWDPAFLSQYDPERLADACQRAGLNAVMIYAKSHVGLCSYPTEIGRRHGNLGDRDLVKELNDALRGRGIATAAYQSITFDNWAAQEHPDWAQIDRSTGRPLHDRTRYGVCCPNNLEYREYELGIMAEILTGYEFDALWLDMIFFLAVCSCPACTRRFREEDGLDIPGTVDWTDPTWATFQAARRRWIAEWTEILIARAHELRPGIAVTHNLANALSGWRCAQPLQLGRLDTYTSLDLYGDRYEHLVVTKMAQHLSASQPAELMVSAGLDLIDHVTLKSADRLSTEALAASAAGSAFIVIDGMDPVGTEQEGAYEVMAAAFESIRPYEADMGGTPVEDVAVYLSDHSLMDFADNGTPVGPPTKLGGDDFPHVLAARGAARALTEAHIPFGVITENDLDRLHEYGVVVLPDLSRITEDEVTAFRDYVRNGGALYASGYSSLVGVDGVRHDDFLLAYVLGVRLVGEEDGRVVYLEPDDHRVADAILPQRMLSQPFNDQWGAEYTAAPLCTIPRVEATTATATARLVLPYGAPEWGSVDRKTWASIHSAPPWERTGFAALAENRVGEGRAVYSPIVLERADRDASRALFTALIADLLGDRRSLTVDARRGVWASVYDQADRGRYLVTLHHYGVERPAPEEPVVLTLRAPEGRTLGEATAGPGVSLQAADTEGGAITVTATLDAELGYLFVSHR